MQKWATVFWDVTLWRWVNRPRNFEGTDPLKRRNYSPNDIPSNCVRPGSTTHRLLTFCRTWEKYTQQYDWQTACKTAKKIKYSSLLCLLADHHQHPCTCGLLQNSATARWTKHLVCSHDAVTPIYYMTAFYASGTNHKQGSGALWHPKTCEYLGVGRNLTSCSTRVVQIRHSFIAVHSKAEWTHTATLPRISFGPKCTLSRKK
jgi:hypothetical protein